MSLIMPSAVFISLMRFYGRCSPMACPPLELAAVSSPASCGNRFRHLSSEQMCCGGRAGAVCSADFCLMVCGLQGEHPGMAIRESVVFSSFCIVCVPWWHESHRVPTVCVPLSFAAMPLVSVQAVDYIHDRAHDRCRISVYKFYILHGLKVCRETSPRGSPCYDYTEG